MMAVGRLVLRVDGARFELFFQLLGRTHISLTNSGETMPEIPLSKEHNRALGELAFPDNGGRNKGPLMGRFCRCCYAYC